LNRNKRSVSLDLAKPEGVKVLKRLLVDADVLIDNFKPGGMEKFGLTYSALEKEFPRLVVAHVTAFGSVGPLGGLPGVDPVGQALSGYMSWQGAPGTPPQRIGVSLTDITTGLFITSAILMALHERNRSGRGQEIEVTLLDASLQLTHPFASDWFMSGNLPKKIGNRHPSSAPYDVYKCKNGYMIMCCTNNGQFRKLCQQLGKPEMADDPRFADLKGRFENQDAIDAEISKLCADKDKNEIAMSLLRAGIPAAPVYDLGEALTNPHLKARDMIFEDPSVGYRMVGTPIKFSRTPGKLHQRPARFAEHNRPVLQAAGFSDSEIDALIAGRVVFDTMQKA
jgi:formyl-CoA transferase